MKLAIMQPYLFPYVGYFQLAASVDAFVFYDDVNYIKNGWINRNRMLLDGRPHYFTVPLAGASPSQKIADVRIQPPERWRRKVLEALRHGYGKAPHYARVSELVGDVLCCATAHMSTLATRSVIEVCNYLGIDARFVMSSAGYGNDALKGAQRVLDICVRERAARYVNLPGGRTLYDDAAFAARGIALEFIEPNLEPYRQFGAEFVPGLSIIDVLMFNDATEARAMLMQEARS
ncbi:MULTISPECIES: WbqC family protein [Burkholderia]|uniref:WbqC family protein n=1 Tax=Burkholderia TaxID=32008 RepID=UPI000530F51A|nr:MULTISPECIES: WbqC family protein [Burkholderia]AOK45599.1 hypothetical protein WT60_01090 [Burkholderia sp. MSMB617WGS]KGR96318.1 wbqC-like family protein [Burkholderia sp. ABCPW 111]KVK77104.1 hypothetical protein WS91_01515 [Burkholderia sp. MSMB1498]KWZ40072.1 hypothetical protein WS73_22065 [Burkholderia savannae]